MANKKLKKVAKPQKPGRTAQKKRQPKKRQLKPAANLPEPIDVAVARVQAKPQDEKSSGLLSGLGSLFSDPDNPGKGSISEGPSVDSLSGNASLPLESERLLSHVPERIGGEADDPGGPADMPGNNLPADDPIAALMAQVAFEPQDVQDVIEEFFEWLSEHYQSDHWKLSERQSRMLGRPAAQLLNSMWVRLQNYLPDILSKWCEETPGAMAFIMACGIVVAPKVTQQITISRERARAKQGVNERLQSKAPQPIRSTVQHVRTVNDMPQGVHERMGDE